MTCIVTTCKTKKELKERIARRERVAIADPSIVAPRFFYSDELKEGEEVVVTNHPKRSWFAQVGRRNGALYVK